MQPDRGPLQVSQLPEDLQLQRVGQAAHVDSYRQEAIRMWGVRQNIRQTGLSEETHCRALRYLLTATLEVCNFKSFHQLVCQDK